jgi:hypothetical protein
MEEEKERQVGRRRLLRGAGAVVAGVAGAGVAGAVAATPASADTLGNTILGIANTANATTSIELTGNGNPAATAALQVKNATGPALLVSPSTPEGSAPAGSVFVDEFGDITTVGDVGTGTFPNHMYSPTWAAQPFPVNPVRFLDTRHDQPPGLVNVLPGSGSVVGDKIIPKSSDTLPDLVLDFSHDLAENYVAVQVNLTVLNAPHDGWVSIWGDGAWPHTVTLNFLAGRVIGGFAHSDLTGVFVGDTEPFGHLKIKVTHAVSLVVDVVGFITPDYNTLFLPNVQSKFGVQTRIPKIAPRRN